MTTDNLARLEGQLRLRDGALSAFAGIPDLDLGRLADAIDDALRRESQALEAGTQEALGFVPGPLRAMAAKLLFPRGAR